VSYMVEYEGELSGRMSTNYGAKSAFITERETEKDVYIYIYIYIYISIYIYCIA